MTGYQTDEGAMNIRAGGWLVSSSPATLHRYPWCPTLRWQKDDARRTGQKGNAFVKLLVGITRIEQTAASGCNQAEGGMALGATAKKNV